MTLNLDRIDRMAYVNEDYFDDVHEISKNTKNDDHKIYSDDTWKKQEQELEYYKQKYDDPKKLKDPNFIVRAIRFFRGLYNKYLLKARIDYKKGKASFIQKFLGSILELINYLSLKLEKLTDRRSSDQISTREKLSYGFQHKPYEKREFLGNGVPKVNKNPGKYQIHNDLRNWNNGKTVFF